VGAKIYPAWHRLRDRRVRQGTKRKLPVTFWGKKLGRAVLGLTGYSPAMEHRHENQGQQFLQWAKTIKDALNAPKKKEKKRLRIFLRHVRLKAPYQ